MDYALSLMIRNGQGKRGMVYIPSYICNREHVNMCDYRLLTLGSEDGWMQACENGPMIWVQCAGRLSA